MTLTPFYQAGGASLYCGDCRDVLTDLPTGSVDLVLTDPPYGKQFAGEGLTTRRAAIRADGARQGVRVVRQALFAALRVLAVDAHVLVFCHWESWPDFYDAVCPLVPIKNALVWHKDRGGAGDTQMEYARGCIPPRSPSTCSPTSSASTARPAAWSWTRSPAPAPPCWQRNGSAAAPSESRSTSATARSPPPGSSAPATQPQQVAPRKRVARRFASSQPAAMTPTWKGGHSATSERPMVSAKAP